MRKYGAFWLLAVICLLLAACGEKPKEPDAAPLAAGAYTAASLGRRPTYSALVKMRTRF